MNTLAYGTYLKSRRNFVERLVDALFTWQERASQRHTLEGLSDHALKDIGLTRVDVAGESRKPFWRA